MQPQPVISAGAEDEEFMCTVTCSMCRLAGTETCRLSELTSLTPVAEVLHNNLCCLPVFLTLTVRTAAIYWWMSPF